MCLFYNAEPSATFLAPKLTWREHHEWSRTQDNIIKEAGSTHTAKLNSRDTSLSICPQQTINILVLHDFDVHRRHFALGAISRCEEFVHLIADLLDVTGVMNKHQQHQVLHTIGVYQQLTAYLPALFSQQKLLKHLPKCKGNISASNAQQILTVEHNAILNITTAVLTQDSHTPVLTQEVDVHVHSSLIFYFIRHMYG